MVTAQQEPRANPSAAAGTADNALPSALLRPDGSRWDMRSIYGESSSAQRVEIMRHGVAPTLSSLAGYEFAGTNIGFLAGLIGARKFKKGFYEGLPRTAQGPEPFVQGYNIDVRQNGVGEPHLAKPSDEAPKRYGFYRVHGVVPGAKDRLYENALLLDYSLGGNGFFNPTRLLRDYLVQVYADDPDLLLGHAFGAIFGLRIPVSFFVLERMNRHDYSGA